LRNIFIFTFEVKLKNGIATFEAKKEREIFFSSYGTLLASTDPERNLKKNLILKLKF
jgi:hypothetical protein